MSFSTILHLDESPSGVAIDGEVQSATVAGLDLDDWIHGFSTEQSQQTVNTFNATGAREPPRIVDSAIDEIQHGVEDWAHILLTNESTVSFFEGFESGQQRDAETSDDTEMINTNGVIENDQRSADYSLDGESRVCYGMIYRVHVKLLGDMSCVAAQLSSYHVASQGHGRMYQTFALKWSTDRILLLLPEGNEFGYLQQSMHGPLCPLLARSDFEVEAVAILENLRNKISKVTRVSDASVVMDINIYGPRSELKEVGETLSFQKVWLQRPEYCMNKIPYENPQFIRFPDLKGSLQLEGLQNDAILVARRRDDPVQQIVSEIHASTHRAQDLERASGDRRLLTELLEHQERALSFMLQRESGDIPDKFRLWEPRTVDNSEMFVHRITGTRSSMRPDEKGGGVLADDMGMGKSLSILALIIETVEEGREWAENRRSETHAHAEIQEYTHSTLVIVPSALLVNNWLNEINKHLGDAVKAIKYHGPKRERDPVALSRSDIVITTYKTLATDYASQKSPLHGLGWFRVVLDEGIFQDPPCHVAQLTLPAHNIRRPTTTFHGTCAKLNARASWCLTGTPIQNRLEDIGALFAFLKAEPFDTLTQFRRFLVVPFEQGDPIAKERLVMLYDSLVLRRTKDILPLLGMEERVRKLELTPEETAQYKATEKLLDRFIRQQVGKHEVKSKFGLFQAHLQLRILCNHGTHQQIFSWKKRNAVDEREAILAELGLNAEMHCAICRQPQPIVNLGNGGPDFVENCTHILCVDCLDHYDNFQSGSRHRRHCPLCQKMGKKRQRNAGNPTLNELTDGRDRGTQESEANNDRFDNTDGYFNLRGSSTKMNALLEDVREALKETGSEHSGEIREPKSIIFSCWTRTLDLIQMYLERDDIDFLRIDGACPLSRRQEILDGFAQPGGPRVMLMTTGTGAFGLNLTSANRIFIVELQWNPSVEQQAIARAIRLGQKDQVIVTRYIMRNTVEQEMKSQQFKKQLAAQAGFGGPEE